MPITSKNHLTNNLENVYIMETNDFLHLTKFTDSDDFKHHIRWSLKGIVPEGISINSETGLISGKILNFEKQPYVNNSSIKEETEYDGSNYLKNGRFKEDFFEFKFTITRHFITDCTYELVTRIVNGEMINKREIKDIITTDFEESDVIMKVFKNQSLDTLVFIESYLETSKTSKLGDRTTINIDGIVYTNKHKVAEILFGDKDTSLC